MEKMLLTGDIAKQLGVPFHRVQYLLRSRKIKEAQRAGGYRLFLPSIVGRLRSELDQIEARKANNVA